METVENLEPICARCLTPLRGLWAATWPKGFLICGDGGCQRWARARGEELMFTGNAAAAHVRQPPVTARRKRALCDQCRKWLPTARRHQFIVGTRRYCTLTCQQEAAKA